MLYAIFLKIKLNCLVIRRIIIVYLSKVRRSNSLAFHETRVKQIDLEFDTCESHLIVSLVKQLMLITRAVLVTSRI